MKASDIPDLDVLNWLYDRQGQWSFLWYGEFVGREADDGRDVYLSMPSGTPPKVALAKMRQLHKRGFVGGCDCGCRGDFEITDKGLAFLGKPRLKKYTGY